MVTVGDVVVGADPDQAGVRVERAPGGVCQVIFDRPGTLNALDVATATELVRVLRGIQHDDGVRVVILTGANGAFCSGADLNMIDQFAAASEAEVAATLKHTMRAAALLRAMPPAVLTKVGIAEARRVAGLGPNQSEALISELS